MYDVIILGSGPAGLTAGIYAKRLGLNPVIVGGRAWGGQLQLTTDVENFPGTAHIQGPELMGNMRKHAEGLQVPIIEKMATEVTRGGREIQRELKFATTKEPFVVMAEDEKLEGKTVIVATGADTKWLGVPSEGKLRGRGLSSCAPCDAFFFKGKSVAVVGGGDSAMEETQVLAGVSPDIVLIHRRDTFRAQHASLEKIKALPNVRFLYNTQVVDVLGETSLTGLHLYTESVSPNQGVKTFDELVAKFGGTKVDKPASSAGKEWILPRQGVFVAIGLVPNTQIFKGLELNSHGYVKRVEKRDTQGNLEFFTMTNIPGMFTAGDVHDARYKQAITAAGFGCMAALDVHAWLAAQ